MPLTIDRQLGKKTVKHMKEGLNQVREVETKTKHSDDHGASKDHWRGESDELDGAVLEDAL